MAWAFLAGCMLSFLLSVACFFRAGTQLSSTRMFLGFFFLLTTLYLFIATIAAAI